jgi:hypothetical protein
MMNGRTTNHETNHKNDYQDDLNEEVLKPIRRGDGGRERDVGRTLGQT